MSLPAESALPAEPTLHDGKRISRNDPAFWRVTAPLAFGANCGVGASDLLVSILGMTRARPDAIVVAKAVTGIVKGVKLNSDAFAAGHRRRAQPTGCDRSGRGLDRPGARIAAVARAHVRAVHPGKGLDFRSAQVCLEGRSLVDRRCLGQLCIR